MVINGFNMEHEKVPFQWSKCDYVDATVAFHDETTQVVSVIRSGSDSRVNCPVTNLLVDKMCYRAL